jgi:hypothetical protein
VTAPHPYGYCPKCGAPGVSRERRPNGDDRCEDGHVYPSSTAVYPSSTALSEPRPLHEEFAAVPAPVLHLWLLTGTATGYDSYDSCVVAAFTDTEARGIHPRGPTGWEGFFVENTWAAAPAFVTAKVIGIAADPTIEAGEVLCSSFNAA